MKDLMKKTIIIIFFTMGLFICGPVLAKEPQNLGLLKLKVIKYHDSGEYLRDINKAVANAERYLARTLATKNLAGKKLAIVLDIDDTTLLEYKHWLELNFGGTYEQMNNATAAADGEAILSTLHLYNFAKQHQVAVFFITGRRDGSEAYTEKNLKNAGFANWDGLFVRPAADHEKTVTVYKTNARKKLVDQGYDILLNMGDQYSDLIGGYADKTIKLPNPYYYIP
ncbi:MAG: HAD family acid phosphatase [Gammaproteobacteria bacterium]|nr:HAD family acid phosphatase [Gammaproteobacteria bacterium]